MKSGMQLCSLCGGSKVMHTTTSTWDEGTWLEGVYTEKCPQCFGSGVEEFECHEGCPPYEHFHDDHNDVCMPHEVNYPPWAAVIP